MLHIHAIENTFLILEKRYEIELTRGLDSFMAKVFNRIRADSRIKECFFPRIEYLPFQADILTDACREELPVYACGILEKEFQRRNIAFIEEAESVFRESIRELDKEAEEDPDDPELVICTEHRLGQTDYFWKGIDSDSLINEGKWYLMRISIRQYYSDIESLFYASRRLCRYGTEQAWDRTDYDHYYVMEYKTDDDSYDSIYHRLYVQARIYDAAARMPFEKYGAADTSTGKYVLEIDAGRDLLRLQEEITGMIRPLHWKSEGAEYYSVDAVYYGVIAECLELISELLGRAEKRNQENSANLIVYGPFCPMEDDVPKHCGQ